MSRTRVVHCKHEHYDIYIARPSIWGNPFIIGRDGTREQVIEKYREYARNNPLIQSELDALEGKVLGCWCKPSACHGDVLVELLEERKEQRLLEAGA
jgi:hypothetical protein